MGSPGIPARLRKVAALAERGPAGPAATQVAGTDPISSAWTDPYVPAAYVPLAAPVLDVSGKSADNEPDVIPHFMEAPPEPPVLLSLGQRRNPRSVRPRRGRPRSEHADRMILLAANEVIADKGVNGLTIEEVASRAGVGKTTIYRRWSSRGTLALDAYLAEIGGERVAPATAASSRVLL